MNALLDLFVCGPSTAMCGGISNLIQGDDADLWNDFKIWNTFSKNPNPPIPKVIDVSLDSSEDNDDMVSMLSEVEVARNLARYRDMLMEEDGGHDLLLLEMELEDEDDEPLWHRQKESPPVVTDDDDELGSLACSFDSRMMMQKDCDGSSYSSYYFRLAPPPVKALDSSKASTSVTPENSWNTTSTHTTHNTRNPSIFR
jgi:hypothetical protein